MNQVGEVRSTTVADRLRNRWVVVAMAGATALGAANLARAGSKDTSTDAIVGPQIELVCAYPSDASSCDVNSVRQIGEQMQAYLGSQHPGGVTGDGGAPGFSARLAEDASGNLIVNQVQLDANSAQIVQMAEDSYNSPNAQDNLLDYTELQVQAKTGDSSNIEYATFITNTPNLEQAKNCAPGFKWGGNARGQNVVVNYVDSLCTDPSYPYLSYQGLAEPAIFDLAGIFHNDGYLQACDLNHTDGGWSTNGQNLLGTADEGFLQNWWKSSIGDWMKSTQNCMGADVDEHMDWSAKVAGGKGTFQYFIKNYDGSLTQVGLDPGSRMEAGAEYVVKYVSAPGETFENFSGSCIGKVCDFIVSSNVSIQANVSTAPTKTKHTLTVKATGAKVTGKGINTPSDNKEVLPNNYIEKLTAKPNRKNAKVIWKGCGKVTGNVCTVVLNKNKLVEAAAK